MKNNYPSHVFKSRSSFTDPKTLSVLQCRSSLEPGPLQPGPLQPGLLQPGLLQLGHKYGTRRNKET
jgi:hypothetical protein